MTDGNAVDWRELNRANWDDRVPVHLASEFYDLDGFRSGVRSLRPFESAEVGDVTGKRLVHLRCHVGLDTLSWARLGARVTGLDFSEPAIKAARSLADDLAVDASFVVADVYDATTALGGRRFDVVYTGTGALVWLPDMTRWAQVVAALLGPGGFLYLVEGHPVAQILDDAQGMNVVRDYFAEQPSVEDYPYTYTDGPALTHIRSVQFQHGLGQVVTALAAAGLRIEFLNEHDFDCYQRFQSLERHDGPYRFPAGQPRIPMMFSLRASPPPRFRLPRPANAAEEVPAALCAELPYCEDVIGDPALALRRATSVDVKSLAAVMARAFFDDPPLTWMLPDPATRLPRVTRMFATVIGVESLRYGGVDIACEGEKILGGAIWLPPGHWQPALRVQIHALPTYARAFAAAWGRAARYGHALEDAHPKESHWYLKAIGVDPGWQGRGVASPLLRSRLERCDQDGQPAYLETSKPDNVPLYEHFGFRRIGDVDMPAGAPVITAMWRAPAT